MKSRVLLISAAALALMFSPSQSIAAQTIKTGKAAFGDWRDDAPGVRRLIKPGDLPRPAANESVANFPDKAAKNPDASPNVPQGFKVEEVVSGLEGPRVIRFAPNGDMFVANSKANEVRVYRMTEGTAKPAQSQIFAARLHKPYGIAFYPPGPEPKWIYIANSHSVVRFAYKAGDLKASGKAQIIVDHIPETDHWTRDIAFSPDGKTLYLSVGSGSNVALDMFPQAPRGGLEAWNKNHPVGAAWGTEERRADVLTFDPDGRNEKIFATGLRNCSGLTIQPATGHLWCVVNERDELGDNVPFEYATEVREGHFYGWPWYYIGDHEDPRHKGARKDLAGKVTLPDVLIQAHSAPLGIAFYEGADFPTEYKGDAFVTLHGSWNRGKRTGYKVVRLLFEDGKPTGVYEDFMTGFVHSDAEVWGRPVGVAVGKDGSLFVSDDGSGTIWRITRLR
jgi:glucose/arabinose dehydrogenase